MVVATFSGHSRPLTDTWLANSPALAYRLVPWAALDSPPANPLKAAASLLREGIKLC